MEYGLIGEKLGHSYSKPIHEMLADYTYEICPLTKEEFPIFMEKREFRAINVTIPYKRDVIPYLTTIDEKAKSIGAVNTIVNHNGKLHGYNTDYPGLLYSLRHNHITLAGQKVLVLGNGGAAQAVFAILRDEGAREILTVKYKEEPGTITYEEARAYHTDADLIINTSPVGMYPNTDRTPMDLTPYENCKAVVDLIYNPAETLLLSQARTLGKITINGLEMLVAQAKYAAEHFLGRLIPDTETDRVYQAMLTYKPNH
ncbi:MAG: shikimate dehydrogenase [Lachnospiraceae bacterium]|nr:shikimate dehydrogenase [Lachnospiraceae bacterium]